ncbi:DNA-binding protein [Schizopora paradoxa]|uniref:DNA-binding protein n=1 Tax=Schizopora paradoxa TaxID=27342 RepID=A0A0H2RGT5_9AGAM|nr:DNA-binding protein [Schizopora paradoxa]
MARQLEADAGRYVTEIIEIVIHNILYLRQIYPPELFVRRKKFNVPVFQCASDTLNNYISGITAEIGKELRRLQKIALVILDGEEALERYSFILKAHNRDIEAEWQTPENLGSRLRAALVKLNTIDAVLPSVTPSVIIETGPLENIQDGARVTSPSPEEWEPATSNKPAALEKSQDKTFHVKPIDIGKFQLTLEIAEFNK